MWLAILFKLVSSMAMVVSNALWKKPIQKESFVNIIAVRAFFSSCLFLGLFFVVYRFNVLNEQQLLIGSLHQSVSFWMYTVLLIAFSYGGLYYFLKAIESGKTITVLAPLGGMAQIFSILTAVIFFHEQLAWNRALSILFFMASIFVYYRLNANKEEVAWRSKTIFYLIISCIVWGISFTLLVSAIRTVGSLTVGCLTELIVFSIALLQVKFVRRSILLPKRTTKQYAYFLLMASCIVLGMLLNNISLTLLPVSMIVLIGLIIEGAYLFIGKWILKETLQKNEWWSFILTTIALLLLVVSF